MVFFDIHIVDTDTKSYLSHSPIAVLASAKAEKKGKYCEPILSIISPLHHCAVQLMVLARSLSLTWEHHYG